MTELYRYQKQGVRAIERFNGRALLADEMWKVVPGFRKRYSVSNYGRVKSKGRLLKQSQSDSGHCRVTLCRDGKTQRFLVHRLVLELFVGPCPDGMECRHIDGDATNNDLDNLAWGTKSQNVRDAVRHQTANMSCGEGHMNCKLTWRRVRKIRRLYATGNYSQRKLARIFGVHQTNITCIVNLVTWKE